MPNTWFQWHAGVIKSGARVLDLACGSGTHAIAAAEQGAEVVAVDIDPERLKAAERAAAGVGVSIQWLQADLTKDPLPDGQFDVVMIFNFLDRARMPQFLEAVKPGGYLMSETFLEQQRELGWGPTSDEHLLKSGELWSLVRQAARQVGAEDVDGSQVDGRAHIQRSQRPLTLPGQPIGQIGGIPANWAKIPS